MDKKISIIVPAYNIEEYLSRCLDSLIGQTYHNLEIIVVDDGSSDKTGEILDQYAKLDQRIVALHTKNQGVSVARNIGLDLATGQFIGFVDGDDLVEQDMFETLIKIAIEQNVDIAHCGYQMVFSSRVDYYYNTGTKRKMSCEEGLQELLKGKMIEPGLWNKLYRAELFTDVRLPIGVAEREDLFCNFELFSRARNSFFYDVPKYHYMIREGAATTERFSEKRRRDSLWVASSIFSKIHLDDALYSTAYEQYLRVLIRNANQDDWKDLKQESIAQLKLELKNLDRKKKCYPKTRYMAWGAAYTPFAYKIVRKMFDFATGANRKYLN